MDMSLTRAKTTTLSLLFPILLLLFFFTSSPYFSILVGFLILGFVVVAARATMVTWITVLVLLAFAGNRRRVLVKQGRLITNDVALFLLEIFLKKVALLLWLVPTLVSFLALKRMS
ncbi:hypothetical protein UlMin_007904 [Ulmus minor]